MKYLWLPVLLLDVFFGQMAARAGTRICNDTKVQHQLAVTLHTGGRWVAQGWQPLPSGDCAEPVPQGYHRNYFYFRAESPGYRFRDDSVRFCTAPGRFRIEDGADCALQDPARQGFAKAVFDTENRTIQLSRRSHPASGSAAIVPPQEIRRDAENKEHYSVDVVFQGCTQPDAAEFVTCRFVGNGMKFGAEGRVEISDPVFTYLLGLLHGTPLEVDGEMTTRFGNSGSLELYSVTPRAPNRFDRMLEQMQGEWMSERNPMDRFEISGAVRRFSYGGIELPPEFIAVQGSCGGTEEEGDYLKVWDSLSSTSLCYQIKSLTDETMTLIYLPQGTRLDYWRLY
ncbi:hypothetical protein METH_06050 [Leisingera methylohalidivorans DSM 14336]|uniref:Uncharacterized protein n=2 Tax=Leisingera methylohalidivorans TaxID=133924 RepID=V9VYU2_9RHOB|nr:hypothetical protein METH_06050 [Leisingera methylohalidivorans DSM 14336]